MRLSNIVIMKYIWLIIFLILPIVGVLYTAWRMWHLLPFSIAMKWVAVGVLVVWFSTIFIAFSGALEKMPLFAATAVYEVGFSFIFILLYLVMLFLVLDVGRLVHIVPKAWLFDNGYTSIGIFAFMLLIFGYGSIHYNNKVREQIDIKRLVHIVPKAWLFDNGYTSIGIFAFMLLIFGYGSIHYNNKVREQIDIKTDKAISLEKKSTKIVLLSDLHLGYHNRRSDFRKWVDMINAEQPDLILTAGDIIDISVRPLMEENVAEEFHRLKAPVYACLGNHEYYSNQPKARRFYREAGITLLQDSVAKIGNLCIIGRDDRTNMQRKSLAMIMEEARKKGFISDLHHGKSSDEFFILLDHQPYHLEEAEQNGIDFQFSGHTHHGQVWPVSWVTDALYEKAYGSLQKGNTQYYISSGLGIWGGKFRIGTQSEYVVLTIEHK